MTDRLLSSLEQRITWTPGLRSTDKAVLLALARWYAWRPDGTHIRPTSLTLLSQQSGVPERSVDRALSRLVTRGWLTLTARTHREPATYDICLDRLATDDPDQLRIVVDHPPDLARHSGAQDEDKNTKVARKTDLARHSGAQAESGAQGIRPVLNNVARTDEGTDLYVQEVLHQYGERTSTGYTHGGAAAPAELTDDEPEPPRHPNHAYCGAWFCVPHFLDDQFARNSGWDRAQRKTWYRAENAHAIRMATPIRYETRPYATILQLPQPR